MHALYKLFHWRDCERLNKSVEMRGALCVIG